MEPEEKEKKKGFAERFAEAWKSAAKEHGDEQAAKTPEELAAEREDAVPEDPRAFDDDHLKVP